MLLQRCNRQLHTLATATEECIRCIQDAEYAASLAADTNIVEVNLNLYILQIVIFALEGSF